MKKTYQRLPESELDIMLVLWNGTPPMTRPEIEKVINTKKKLASTTILSLLTRLESKNFVEVTKQGKLNLYTPLVSQSDYQAHESQSVLEKLYGNSGSIIFFVGLTLPRYRFSKPSASLDMNLR